MTRDEFVALVDRLPLVGRPSSDAARVAAARLVQTGAVVCAGDTPAMPGLAPDATVEHAVPAPYQLDQWVEAAEGWVATNDRFSVDVHGPASMTHLDTPEHFAWGKRRMVSPSGGAMLQFAREGLVSKGVLVNVPVAPNEVVTLADLKRALAASGATVQPGDALYLRFGRTETARSGGALQADPVRGLSIECAEWMAEHRPGVVVTDEGLDPYPSEVDGIAVPWHVLLLTVLDIPLVDRAALTAIAEHCSGAKRWEFFSVIAPLPIPGASGSPVNPLAIF